jgi:nucleoid-associated protein YgaU
LARRYYARGSRYPVIFHANRHKISDPDILRPCRWIRIPGKRRRG